MAGLDLRGRRRSGSARASGLTHEDVQHWVNGLRDSGLKAATVHKAHAVLSAAMTEGCRRGLVRANPCQHIRLPRQEHREMLFLSPAEVATLADAIHPSYRVAIYMAAYTGLRAGELWALQRKHLDPLLVERALTETNGKLAFGPTKTHGRRSLRLPRFLLDLLKEHLAEPSSGGTGPESLVFPTVNGRPVQQRLFYGRYFRPTVKRLVGDEELPADKASLRFHDLRHSCASFLIASGAHAKSIQAQLGHESIAMTMDRYGHLLPSLADQLADALDSTYAGEEPGKVTALRR